MSADHNIIGRESADAVHESSHAVTAHCAGFAVLSVDIIARGDFRGQCRWTPPRPDPRGKLVVVVAGIVGEGLAGFPYRPDLTMGNDFQQARILVRQIAGVDAGDAVYARIIATAMDAANRLLVERWEAVETIARLLVRDGSVSGAAVARTMELATLQGGSS